MLPAIHDFVDGVASDLGLPYDDAFACRLATDEAATNAFEHAYSGLPGKVEVALRRDGQDVVLSVRNWGQPFDPDAVPTPEIDKPLDERNVGGLGLFLMRRFMQDVSFDFDPVSGNVVTMRRRLAQEAG
jgi:serine/threonine-protein kinase RsbW